MPLPDNIISQQPEVQNSIITFADRATNGNVPTVMQCNKLWMQIQTDVRKEQKQNRKKIDIYVKDELFRELKFIPSGNMMLFSAKTRSISQLVCSALNIPADQQQVYWDTYYRYVKKSINAARNDAVAAVKKTFFKCMKNTILNYLSVNFFYKYC